MWMMFNRFSSPLLDVDPKATKVQESKKKVWVGAGEEQEKEQNKLTLEVQSYQDLHTL